MGFSISAPEQSNHAKPADDITEIRLWWCWWFLCGHSFARPTQINQLWWERQTYSTDKKIYRQTETDRQQKNKRQTNRKNKQTDKQTNRQTNRQKNRQTNRQTDKQTDRQTTHTSEKQRDKQTDSRLADFQNRQKERQTEKQAQIVNRQTNRSGKQFRETGY